MCRLSADTGFRDRGPSGGLLQDARGSPEKAAAAAAASGAAAGGLISTTLHRFKDELSDVQAGFSYIGHTSNRCGPVA